MGDITTAVISSDGKYNNADRFRLLEDLIEDISCSGIVDNESDDPITERLLVLPGGYFNAGKNRPHTLYNKIEKRLADIIPDDLIITCGVDGREQKPWPKDQMAIALSNDGIIANGRKFHPAPGENIQAATDYLVEENGKSRFFEFDEKEIYLAVCYDSFGIRQKNLPNPDVDLVLDHIHGFYPKAEGNSGEAYFAKHGLAGASKIWDCPVFGSAVFFRRDIPPRWPTGVKWTLKDKGTMYWKYSDNPIKPIGFSVKDIKEGTLRLTHYNIN